LGHAMQTCCLYKAVLSEMHAVAEDLRKADCP